MIVEECRDSLSHHQGRIFPDFPPSHPLHDPSFSLSIFSHLLILPEDLSEIEDGFNPYKTAILLLVYPIMTALLLDSGLGHFYFTASKSCIL